jgi:hypothetical protein
MPAEVVSGDLLAVEVAEQEKLVILMVQEKEETVYNYQYQVRLLTMLVVAEGGGKVSAHRKVVSAVAA